jgi:heme/copper-type cytochrome/quinol oxidase subunit 1
LDFLFALIVIGIPAILIVMGIIFLFAKKGTRKRKIGIVLLSLGVLIFIAEVIFFLYAYGVGLSGMPRTD